MKKLTLIITFIFLIGFFSPIYAKKDDGGKSNKAGGIVETTEEQGEEQGENSPLSASEAAKSRNAIRKLEKIQEKTNNPEVGQEVQFVIQEQTQVQERVEESLEQADERPSFVKFLIGPDYKNLGQLRKEIVQTRNNIRQLEKIGAIATGEAQVAIDEAIDELQSTALNLQASIGEKLEGFSLFGWLARWLSGFDAPVEPSETPIPTVEPSSLPEATLEPEQTPESTPSATPNETELPSPSPET